MAKVVSNTLEINLILEMRALNVWLTQLDFTLVSRVKDYSKSTQDTRLKTQWAIIIVQERNSKSLPTLKSQHIHDHIPCLTYSGCSIINC